MDNQSTTEEISICHILNSVDETSTEAEWAVEQSAHEDVSKVTIVSWFNVGEFRGRESVNVECLNLPDGSLWLPRKKWRQLRDVLEQHDVIHTHHNHSGFYAKLLAWRLGKPIVSTEHNNHESFTRKGRIVNGLTNVLANEVVCVSEAVHESFKWWESKVVRDRKTSVIHNGVNLARIKAAKTLEWSIHDLVEIDPQAVVVGSAGMLVEQKAQDVLIDAIDQANAESDQPIELVISGDGELRGELERQIERAEYSDRLHLLGFLDTREQVYKMMHEIDIYAMPSRWEGFCVAALEAMAAGNPCVFSEIDEFKRPFGRIARFHEVDNSVSLSQTLCSLVADSNERQEVRTSAYDFVINEHAIERTVKDYQDCYLRITQ